MVCRLLAPIAATWRRVAPGTSGPAPVSVSLPRAAAERIERRPGVTVLTVMRGTVWVTTTPAEIDLVLEAGDCLFVGRRWPLVVQALADAEVRFS